MLIFIAITYSGVIYTVTKICQCVTGSFKHRIPYPNYFYKYTIQSNTSFSFEYRLKSFLHDILFRASLWGSFQYHLKSVEVSSIHTVPTNHNCTGI